LDWTNSEVKSEKNSISNWVNPEVKGWDGEISDCINRKVKKKYIISD